MARSKTESYSVKCIGRNECNISSLDDVLSSINEFQPDIVVNAAAYTAVDKAEEDQEQAFSVNRDGPANIAKVTADLGIPLVHFSTDYVFDGEKAEPYNEADETDPTGIYGQSKLEGELAVIENNPKHVILRTAWVYSAIGNNFLKTMLRLAADRDELTIVADQWGNPSDAVDMANGAYSVLDRCLSYPTEVNYGLYHFCGPQRMNWADFARAIFEQSARMGGPSANVRDITTAEYPTAAKRPGNSSLDCAKFKAEFGYGNITFKDSIHTTLQALLK